ncbi:hypothetical protein EELLY_v1c02090 [Entomoplasma ellychniae]|uniref:Uncharacterized protein n=1 Tax=Entomoplasma ellychniae TaxID=2114 RepID=A0A8E2U9V3_9MOLU|nr:TIGR04561 family membrane protein [Entomoplasma ellychniae]PPE04529.1 hypothetical protein EELLY_v1c02090 [Entomoplasma ellychniae]
MNNFFKPITIFGTNISFLTIFIIFMSLLVLSLVIFILNLIFKKKKGINDSSRKDLEINKIDEEINSIVKKYRIKNMEEKEVDNG